MYWLLVTAVLIMPSQMTSTFVTQRCGSESSILGTMLRGHTFQKMNTKNSLECVQACDADVRCQSFNYVISEDVCELNNRTKEARAEDFVSDTARFYLKRFAKRGNEIVPVGHDRIALLCDLRDFYRRRNEENTKEKRRRDNFLGMKGNDHLNRKRT